MTLQPVARNRHLDPETIGLQNLAQRRRDRAEQLVAVEVPAHRDVDVEKALQLLVSRSAFGLQPPQLELGHHLPSEGHEGGSLLRCQRARLDVHDANRAEPVTGGRDQRRARIEAYMGFTGHEDGLSETRVVQRVVHDQHVLLLNRLGAQRHRARYLGHRQADGRLEPLAIRIDHANRRERRTTDLRRESHQLVELALARCIEDGIPPQGLLAIRFPVSDHEGITLDLSMVPNAGAEVT
jgi:hypothetical protein